MMRRPSRDQQGTVALFVAICAVMLFSFAAVAVDLGNAYNRKRAVQSQADFAAFAAAEGGLNLPATHVNPLATDQAVIKAAAYLNNNQPQNDATASQACAAARTCVTAAQLVDGTTANGEVYYGHFTAGGATFVPNQNEITVLAPRALVKFGFSGVLGYSGKDVQARATVAIKAAKLPLLPFYAYTGCDYGPQTISEPNNGHAAASVLLSHDNEPSPANQNRAVLTSLTPNTVTPDDNTTSMVIAGTDLTGATQIGFFESGNSGPGPEPITVPATSVSATSVTAIAPLPPQVTSVQNVWYVRVKINNQWSSVLKSNGTLNALTFTVGNALLTCGQGSNDGNFGTLKLQTSGQWQDTARNIALGLEHGLKPFPNPGTGQGADWLCSSTTPFDPFRSVLWPNEGTNCVDTETGMAQNAATAGFVTGLSGANGFIGLLTKDTNRPDSGCAVSGLPATKTFLSKTINNDTLSCFFTSPTTNIGQIVNSTYGLSGPVLDKKIWHSPRLVFVPVLGVEPGQGGSNKYQILTFRPGFITDQTETATKSTPVTTNNGLTPSNNGNEVQSVQIVFFNYGALPDPPGDIPLADFIPGTDSQKILRLVD